MNRFHNPSALIIIAGEGDESECLGTIITSYSSAVIKDPSYESKKLCLGYQTSWLDGTWAANGPGQGGSPGATGGPGCRSIPAERLPSHGMDRG